MAPKKAKKKVAKKKEKVEKDPDEEDENKCPIDIQPYQDPDEITPRANLKITLAKPISSKLSKLILFSFYLLAFTVKEVLVTTRVEEIRQMIIDRHDGSIEDVTICLGSYDAQHNALDPMKTLAEQGVTADADQTLIYDFKPISHPLLTTPLGN